MRYLPPNRGHFFKSVSSCCVFVAIRHPVGLDVDKAADRPLGSQLRAEVAQHPVDLEEIVAKTLDAKERVISALYSRPLQHLV